MTELFGKEQKPTKSLEELFEMLKEEAGEGGAIILMRAKGGKGEAFRVLTAGHIHSVMGLLSIGGQFIQDMLQEKLNALIKAATRAQ